MMPQKRKSNVKEKNIKPINYLYAFLILFGSILLVFCIFKWYNLKNEEKLKSSYLITSSTITSTSLLEDFNHIKQELPASYFIYLSYTGDKNIYQLEKNLKKVIDKYNLNDIFYYIDLTNEKNNSSDYLEKVKTSLKIDELKNIPAIIYVVNGEIKDENVLDGVKGTLLKVEDLEKLLDIYDFEAVS